MEEQKELRRMNRTELIEIIYALQQQELELRKENDGLREELEDRTIRLENAGSIGEAALSLNHIFEDAQAAADQYLFSVAEGEKVPEDAADAICDEIDAALDTEKGEECDRTDAVPEPDADSCGEDAERSPARDDVGQMAAAHSEARQAVAAARQAVAAAREEARKALDEARGRAEEILESARIEADEIVKSARAEADETVRAAGTEADEIVKAARTEADEILETARSEKAETPDEARIEADRILEAAQKEARQIIAGARSEANQTLSDARNKAKELLQLSVRVVEGEKEEFNRSVRKVMRRNPDLAAVLRNRSKRENGG